MRGTRAIELLLIGTCWMVAGCSGPEVAWTREVGRDVQPVAVFDGVVHVGTDAGKLLGLELATGKEVWSHDAGGKVRGTPVLVSDVLYVGNKEGYLDSIDRKTGERRWRAQARGAVDGAAQVAGQRVLFGSHDKNWYAVERNSGQRAWRFPGDQPLQEAPCVVDGVAYMVDRNGALASMKVSTGQASPVLEAPERCRFESPVIHFGRLFVWVADSSWKRTLHCYELSSKELAWSLPVPDRSLDGGIAGERWLTVDKITVLSVELASGKVAWKYQAPAGISSAPALLGKHVLVGLDSGKLVALDAASGELAWEASLDSEPISPAVLSEDYLLMRTDLGKLVALKLPES